MSRSPNANLVHHTINVNYANKKRSKALKWILLNSILLLVFVYDLSCKCPSYTSALHYVELVCVAVFSANLVRYALCLIPSRAPPLHLTRGQQKLLGLADSDLDSSFVLSNGSSDSSVRKDESEPWSLSDAELSLSPRAWRSESPPAPPAPHSPHSPVAPRTLRTTPTLRTPDTAHDRFIADGDSLAAYLKQAEAEAEVMAGAGVRVDVAWPPSPPPPYRLAAAPAGRAEEEEGEGAPGLCWRLDVDPQRVTQWNLNLRLWLHATLLARLSRALEDADAALARAGLAAPGALLGGRVPAARLARSPAAPLLPLLAAARPPAAAYVLRRVRALAAAPCLSAYRGAGGGAGWAPPLPSDAELLLALLTAYVNAQLPPGARPFGDRPTPGPGGAAGAEPALVRVRERPATWALALGGARLAPAGGRDHLLHALLLLLTAAARRSPPTLARLPLGPAGLNMLWIIGR